MNAKTKVARLSLLSNSTLIILKLIVGLATGSVSIISEAIHSTMDLLAAIIAFFSVKISDKPADDVHPYGHGKIENVSGVIEALLILVASIWIIIEAVSKLLEPGEVESIGLGFMVMFISSAINFVVSKKLYAVAKQEDSIALEADALHLKADVYTSLGVGIGLFLIWITKLNFLDPIVAILVSVFILKEAVELLISAFNPLLDVKLSNDEINIIKNNINKYSTIYCNYHDFKTRKSGRVRYIELHLVFPENMKIKDAHDVCDEIENDIKKSLDHSEIMIHLESPENSRNCDQCKNIHL
ncbi:cation diffusion facilitator family transporter [Clostridium saccharoperbutylacetonicum]|uniref:cation diffusion facilitator family transporter n=1 Tax=Clostridium saccharoperbutylacetonicum TaxID=36745 RepID=UPI000983C943|nr:cation diffusion facilitator family transporter [Clostridium saccharoperbutylacetonicum]AQR96924.1 ferrous-iron efflux pump FieF [Clostridium saccharoperbutylacetonicum]NSB32803.1 cation diffusion facilitator family transporter [Clostridium saccharoperbutylacetonicum]